MLNLLVRDSSVRIYINSKSEEEGLNNQKSILSKNAPVSN